MSLTKANRQKGAEIAKAAIGFAIACGLLFSVPFFAFAEEPAAPLEAQDFNAYVQEQRQKERLAAEGEAQAETAAASATAARKKKRIIAAIASVSITAAWTVFMLRLKKEVFAPYAVRDMDIFQKDPEAIVAAMKTMRPMEASVVINVDEFTEYDLLTCLFDMIDKKLLLVERFENEGAAEFRIDCAPELETLSLENYEDFFVLWFIRKIGQGEGFTVRRLRDYLQLDSRATQFDIDYDVWNDELLEYAARFEIKDALVEEWKKRCAVIGLLAAVAGLLALYLSGSAFCMLLFGITFANYRLTRNVERRSKSAQVKYEILLDYWEILRDAIEQGAHLEDRARWDAYFLFSIPLRLTDELLAVDPTHKELYELMESELKCAIGYSSTIMVETMAGETGA